jgi:3-phenylpropionate/trans-cinnamate dioxygenase alpha subunit
LGGVYKIRLRGNWKLAAEQFVGDNYHAGITHSSAFRAWQGERDVSRAPRPGPPPAGRQFSSRLGHGTAGFYLDDAAGAAVRRARGRDEALLARYNEDTMAEAVRRLGAERAGGPATTAGTIFPNCSYLANIFGSSSIGVWHPRGPLAFESWRLGLVDAAAPAEVKQATARMLHVWPIGLADADDGENWSGIGDNLPGPMVQRHAFNFQMGLGHDGDDPVYPGRIGDQWVGELPQRGFYRRWLEFLSCEDWPVI